MTKYVVAWYEYNKDELHQEIIEANDPVSAHVTAVGEYMLPYTDKDMTLEELKIALRDEQDVLVEVIVH